MASSFSGLKTALWHILRDGGRPRRVVDVCASFQEAIVDIWSIDGRDDRDRLDASSSPAASPPTRACARAWQPVTARRGGRLAPPLHYCTDNAAMIAGARLLRPSDRPDAPTRARRGLAAAVGAPPSAARAPAAFGQHFLVDPAVARAMVDGAAVDGAPCSRSVLARRPHRSLAARARSSASSRSIASSRAPAREYAAIPRSVSRPTPRASTSAASSRRQAALGRRRTFPTRAARPSFVCLVAAPSVVTEAVVMLQRKVATDRLRAGDEAVWLAHLSWRCSPSRRRPSVCHGAFRRAPRSLRRSS